MPFHHLLQLARTPLFIISITTLVCLLLSASLLQQQHHQRLEQRTGHYGTALARMAAHQATDATLNHDLVSLQVTVRDVARNPDVLSATIHDVENRLLVQAGSSPQSGDYQQRDTRSFSAPITLQDSVAGYVTVTIDAQALYEQQDDTWLVALLGLAGALLVMSIFNQRQQLSAKHTPQPADTPPHSGDPLPPKEVHEEEAPARENPSRRITIKLVLHCLNGPSLKQQLSATLRQQLLRELQGHLSGVNALYSGRILTADTDNLEVQFQGDDLGTTGFRAICAAQLLFKLLRQSSAGIQLHYSAAVYHAPQDDSLTQQLELSNFRERLIEVLAGLDSGQLLLENSDAATSQLLQRLQYASDSAADSNWLLVEGVQPSYQGLLEKQARQLRDLQTA